MKILNLFAGIGGNRTLWGTQHQITAIENNEKIAEIYNKRFPTDEVIVDDAYEYFINNYENYDILWASPPCISHSRNNYGLNGYVYKNKRRKIQLPDLRLYSLILFCKHMFKGKYLIENVIPYYEPLIKPDFIRGRHMYWTNVDIIFKQRTKEYIGSFGTYEKKEIIEEYAAKRKISLSIFDGFNLGKYKQNQIIRDMILPEEGKYLLDCLIYNTQQKLEAWLK